MKENNNKNTRVAKVRTNLMAYKNKCKKTCEKWEKSDKEPIAND
jgi:hypothetical protein